MIQFMVTKFQQIFANDTTAYLLWDVQISISIIWTEFYLFIKNKIKF